MPKFNESQYQFPATIREARERLRVARAVLIAKTLNTEGRAYDSPSLAMLAEMHDRAVQNDLWVATAEELRDALRAWVAESSLSSRTTVNATRWIAVFTVINAIAVVIALFK